MTAPRSSRPDPRFLGIADAFADPVEPASFPLHCLRFRNQRWAERVGLGSLDAAGWERHLARFEPLPGNLPRPLALRYHGHQFRAYNPQLGDGRGFLFAQLRDLEDGRLLDLGTKGSGRTPWSRDGDGRLTLQGGVREVLATEMLEALGVYTSKSLSLVETGEALFRGDEPSPARSSVLVRLSHGHVRFGSFQRAARLGDREALARLLDYCVEVFFPELGSSIVPGPVRGAGSGSDPDPGFRSGGGAARGADVAGREPALARASLPVAFLHEVVRRSAELCAGWMVAGFVHGVLNTDNLNVTGESFDYGPWRFLPELDPKFTAAYFDEGGLYAFGRQPQAVHWNLVRLAEALAPLGDAEAMRPCLEGFLPAFLDAYRRRHAARLGLRPQGGDADAELLSMCQAFWIETRLPFERLPFDWWGGAASAERARQSPVAALYDTRAFARIRAILETYEPTDVGRLADPYFQADAPCTALIEEVRAIWSAIATRDDWSPFEAKVESIRAMGRALRLEPAAR